MLLWDLDCLQEAYSKFALTESTSCVFFPVYHFYLNALHRQDENERALVANALKGAKLTLVLSALIDRNYTPNEKMEQCNKILE